MCSHKQEEWDKFLYSIDPNDNSIFKPNKNLLKRRPTVHPLTGPKTPVYTATEKAKPFADNFQHQFSPNPGPAIPEVLHNLLSTFFCPNSQNILYTIPGFVSQIHKRLPTRKASGHDNISNTFLMNLPIKVITHLTNILNGYLR